MAGPHQRDDLRGVDNDLVGHDVAKNRVQVNAHYIQLRGGDLRLVVTQQHETQ